MTHLYFTLPWYEKTKAESKKILNRLMFLDTIQDFFDCVGHEIMYASNGNKNFYVKTFF